MGSLLWLGTAALDEPGAERVEQALTETEHCHAGFLSRMYRMYGLEDSCSTHRGPGAGMDACCIPWVYAPIRIRR